MRDFSRRNGNRVVNYIMKDFKHSNCDDALIYGIKYNGKSYTMVVTIEEDIK